MLVVVGDLLGLRLELVVLEEQVVVELAVWLLLLAVQAQVTRAAAAAVGEHPAEWEVLAL